MCKYVAHECRQGSLTSALTLPLCGRVYLGQEHKLYPSGKYKNQITLYRVSPYTKAAQGIAMRPRTHYV
uniref:Uncharacterized protein n=1 Tax=Siphoviridae sp. ctOCb13 TaxID=2825477 RepID=A0A8S5Q006_9CAUD|nr:MAG TPA: hypothetical protein [Siphoviridae sp. ctOCb13]